MNQRNDEESKTDDSIDTNTLNTIEELISTYKIPKISTKEIELMEKIGKGQQGHVYKGKYNGNLVAIKALKEVDMKNFVHELYILSTINHKSFTKLYGLVLESDNISMVTQYINGVSLDKLIIKETNMSFEDRVKIMKGLCEVVQLIHDKGIIHRDLKPENIMVDTTNELNIYLIDFGIAKFLNVDEEKMKTRIMGTIFYIAPETFDDVDQAEDGEFLTNYSKKYDVWSFGCIVSFLFSGIFPWMNKFEHIDLSNKKYKDAVLTKIEAFIMNKDKFPIPNIADERVKEIIVKATEVDVKKRSDMNELMSLCSKIN